jgi:hypothetical protein
LALAACLRTLGGTAVVLACVVTLAGATVRGEAAPPPPDCPHAGPSAASVVRTAAALRARRDVWGNELLARPGGPTFAAARRYLPPISRALGRRGTPITASGFYYVPFAQPEGPRGAGSVALHVADGSAIVAQRVGGPALDVSVGAAGRERYGSCLARLSPPSLAAGWLPVLETRYRDADGARYRQESFAARDARTGRLTSYVAVAVDARHADRGVRLRLSPSAGRSLVVQVPRGATRSLDAAWSPGRLRVVEPSAYADARRSVEAYWLGRLDEGMTITVPESRVEDAERALLVQELELTWRYSIGNPYEEFSFPESVDVAQVLTEQGFASVARSILRTSLTRKPTPYPNWKKGERLLASAEYVRLSGDRSYLDAATPALRGYVTALGRQIESSRTGLLRPERYSSDIPDSVYGLHSQAIVWAGLRAMGDVWANAGRGPLAARCAALAATLGPAIRRAVSESERRLPDGSLFVPVRLLDGEQPYDTVTETRLGSYWNLVMPYALASGIFPPGGPQARGVYRYMLLHGSRLLGLVRAGAYALYGRDAPPSSSGTDEVYGINVARFLADNDQADQLVLSLYGDLAAGMTPGTFVAGEAASVAPLGGERARATYLPPNAAANAAFLETLRLMLVHETADAAGRPRGLELAFATPRAWLAPGKRISVAGAPTSFGPVSYALQAGGDSIRVSVDVPARQSPGSLRLRLRLPVGARVRSVTLAGRPYPRFDAATGTIDLSGRTGSLDLLAHLSRRRGSP